MSNLSRRSGSGVSRTTRERRAYRLVVAGGAASTIAVVTFILAVAGVVGFGLPVLAAIIAIVCVVGFRRTVGS